jgi:hypothetical protein
MTFDRDSIKRVLERWRSGEITGRAVQDEAEELWESAEWPEYDDADDESIASEVVMQLDALDIGWISVDDIPAFLDFLSTPPGNSLDGWRRWQQYWNGIDFERRRPASGQEDDQL